jgi:hypothetical protein
MSRPERPGGVPEFPCHLGSIKQFEAVLLGSDEYFARWVNPGGPANPPLGANPLENGRQIELI